MCVITLLLFSACTSKENFNKKVGEEKKVVNKEEESQKKKKMHLERIMKKKSIMIY